MSDKNKVVELEDVIIKFAGDSGDGMQFTGNQFSDTSVNAGNDLATFPDYPSEVRAPQGTIAGVSGFQIHIGGKDIHTSGDLADVLVAMNPAALRKNLKWVREGGTIIIDIDNFDNKHYKKAGYEEDPLNDGTLKGYKIIKAPITTMTKSSVKELDSKVALKTKNQFVSGMLYFLFNRELEQGKQFLRQKFKNKPKLVEANIDVLEAGYHYAETLEAFETTYRIISAEKTGSFRNITGNVATAWGLMAAAEKSGRPLFLGSYPITPATEILQELSSKKNLGVKTFQAEDEIAGISSAIGASFAGNFGVTTTSGPGLSLKSEAAGLAVMTELPLVIVDVQRGGPATGLPTKPEQSDLLQALYGRNGESPVVVMSAATPGDCFHAAFKAGKIAMEHMVPVILLTDGYLANGSELWNIPDVDSMPNIKPPIAKANDEDYAPYRRNPETLAREWAIPGTEGLRHRIGGLEKEDVSGEVSHDALNHEIMVKYREEKVQRIANYIPEQPIYGNEDGGDVLVVSWGGTYGAVYTAVSELRKQGKDISLAHFEYIKPFPKNTREVLSKFNKIIVTEINNGQFVNYLRAHFPEFNYLQYNKIQGLPFMIYELKDKFNEILEEK
ncbi:MAG: 2-oxoacid:acceptor oxidoreductase subunit alpha [Bacteroidales bacterium]|nr:2-oxoacid:acceptor oxidoreductase subunit alpha [Bacteroidales bacterium]MCF8326679.1 2-oxoacid:acceptor oxidoreductase subunit alpha [Bacteroidales bacterium]